MTDMLWMAHVIVVRRDGTLRKEVDIVVGSQEVEDLKRSPTVIRRALKYSGYSPKAISDPTVWRIKTLVIVKKLGL